MLRRLLHGRTGIAASVVVCLPAFAVSQEIQSTRIAIPRVAPKPPDAKQVTAWSRSLVDRMDGVWSEPKTEERERKLIQLAESTPSELAFVTRVLKQNDA